MSRRIASHLTGTIDSELKISDLFSTVQQRVSAVAAMKGMLRSQGWALIEQMLEINLADVEEQVWEGVDLSAEEIKLLQAQKRMLKKLKDFPEWVIETYKEDVKKESVKIVDDLDPYDGD